ncbi:hypothetical protein BH20ACI3_BH20ACI3_03560 [soil metagenome]
MSKIAKRVWHCLWLTGLLTIFTATSSAQTYTATLTGTVTDPNGASVPNVKVVAVNQGTQLEYEAQTSDSGIYTIPFLPVGAYVVSLEAAGFKKLVSNPIRLEVNQIARVNLQLEIGEITQQVTVQDVTAVLQTESTTVGQVITGETVTSLPLNGRNFQQLTLLVPGAVTPSPSSFTSLSPGAFGGRPYVNGNREQTNAFLLDGISVDETIDNRIGYKPNVDALAEFKVETSNSSAEFGNVAGAIVNATVKSGTNEFHGNLFEFFRNDALDANLWENNRAGAAKQKLRQNIFGGTIGGPVMTNKWFFFFAYQGTKQRTGGGAIRSVAPLAWRQGDFSGVSATIRDPQTGLPFAGNRIDPSRFGSVAKALLANPGLYPLPNRTGNTNNYATTFANQIDGFQFDIKMDARLSEKDIFSGRYSLGRFTELGTQGPLPTELTGKRLGRPQNVALNWTHTFSPILINEARVGFNRALFIVDALDWAGIGDANATLGIPGGQVIPGLSAIRITGLNDIGVLAVTERNATNTFHYGDNLTMIKGSHTLKMGGQLQRYQQNRFYPGNNGLLGFFNYGSTFTGHAFADFLLDTLSSKGIGSRSGTWGHRQNRLGIFFQDDYKVRPNLTLNLGMRWEYASPIYEVKDRQSSFDIITGRQLFAGRDGNSRALYDPYYKAFEPRLGFAWTPDRFESKLVVRAGYGIVQFQEGTGANLRLPLNPPLFSESDRPFDTTTGPGRIALGFTDVIVRDQPAGLIRIWNPKLRPQFTQQWNLTLEYQLTNTMSVSAAYVGNKATNLIAPTDWNQPLPGTGPPSTWLPAQQRRPLFSALPLVTATSGTDSWSRSNYHSGQFSARQRFARGLQFLASYTFGKVLTDNRGFYGSGVFGGDQGAYASNAYNREADYGPAFFDVKHNLVLSGTYELPIGKGRAWGNNWHPAAHALLGGWNMSSIIQARTGFPVTVIDTRVTASSLQAPRAGAFPRPNRLGSGQVSNPSIDQWIDSSAFVQPPLGQFGNSGVGILRGPSFTNWDFSIGKKFYWTEERYFDFRTEFFNILNHPNFTQPGRDLAAPATFGRINNTLGDPRRLELAVKFYF